MVSTVTVKADKEKMRKLFYKRDTYIIEELEKHSLYDKFNVKVKHAEEIGEQQGEFTYDSFLETFDKKFKRMPHLLLEEDLIMAERGLKGGLPTTIMPEVLKVYGSSRCTEKWYIKELVKSDEIHPLWKAAKNKEKNAAAR